ncbi:MAG TPA: hypothetical protein VF602_03440 [Pedobacter sp.]|jgi:hypothetical protein
MELFREEYLTIQDDYLRVDPSREGEGNDADVDYSNDDLGENTEVTPLGDAIKQDEMNDFVIDPDDDDDEYGDDQNLDVEEVEEEDVVDITSQIDPAEDDDLLDDEDDDLLDDDDDLDTTIAPDLDEDDDLLADDEEDDLLDDEDEDDDITARTSIDTNADFSSRDHGRTTGTMLNHDPGLPGSGFL